MMLPYDFYFQRFLAKKSSSLKGFLKKEVPAQKLRSKSA